VGKIRFDLFEKERWADQRDLRFYEMILNRIETSYEGTGEN